MSNKYQYKVQGVDYEVEIAEVEGNIAKVNVNGIPFEVELQQPINAAKHPTLTHPRPLPVREESEVSQVQQPSTPLPRREGQGGGSGNPLKAPLPGTITSIQVKVGDTVAVGDVVVILEAMKMQNNIEAEHAGTVTAINVNPGDSVMEGSVLLTIG